jgi:hypothetical protein
MWPSSPASEKTFAAGNAKYSNFQTSYTKFVLRQLEIRHKTDGNKRKGINYPVSSASLFISVYL